MSGVKGSALERVSSCNLHSPSMKPCVITSLLLARKLEHTEVKQLAQEDRACIPELTQTPASVPFTSPSDQNQPVKNRPGEKVPWLRRAVCRDPSSPHAPQTTWKWHTDAALSAVTQPLLGFPSLNTTETSFAFRVQVQL